MDLQNIVILVGLAVSLITIVTFGWRAGREITKIKEDISNTHSGLNAQLQIGVAGVNSNLSNSIVDMRQKIESKIDKEHAVLRGELSKLNDDLSSFRLEVALETAKKTELAEIKNEINANIRGQTQEALALRDRVTKLEANLENRR